MQEINKKPTFAIIAVLAVLLLVAVVSPIVISKVSANISKAMTAQLSGSQEVPAVNTQATGTATFTINKQNNTLTFDISYQGLSSEETGAHIHGPADRGSNAGVLFALPSGARKTGVWNYPESAEQDILAGRVYVNIHSANHPSGEIRGQIVKEQ